MSTRVVDQVDTWQEQSFSGGHRELHDLADSEFSGVVRAGGAELYMTRGVVVGVRLGDIADFEGASGTAYEAPDDALPLLAIMQERDVDVRAKYYSEETSISKVDKTLRDGGFTGYIELSENVLSGDYYLVYHAGTSMSVAYVGESSKLLQDDEAFDTADDEVGIFKVRQVDVEPIEIPEPAGEPEPAGSEQQPASEPAAEEEAESESDTPEEHADAGSGDDADRENSTKPTDDATVSADDASAETGNSAGTSAETGNSASRSSETNTASGTQPEQRSGSGAVTKQETNAAQTTDTDHSRTANSGDSVTNQANSSPPQTDSRQRAGETARASKTDSEGSRQSPTPREADSSGQETRSNQDRRTQQETAGRQKRRQDTDRGNQQRSTDAAGGRTDTRGANASGAPATDRQSARKQAGAQSTASTRSAQSETSRSRSAAGVEPPRSAATSSGDLETKSIPSIDPAKTSLPDDGPTRPPTPTPDPEPMPAETTQQAAPQTDRKQPQPADQEPPAAESRQPADSQGADQPELSDQQEGPAQPPGVDEELIADLESEIADKEDVIEKLESDLETANRRGDDLEAELDAVRAERDDLAAEVERLETELGRLEEELGAKTDADRRITASEALAGTDIFVRYRSKGKATLKKAHSGSTRKDEVNENIRLEKHTQFDASTVAVGGQTYEEFLEGTLEFQFVQWAVRELLFEIRDTGHEKALADLYDVLPLVDRAELAGVIDVTYTEDGQETQSQESFDVVLRDRMGNPLLAANLNDSREATTEAMMERLITSAERVGQSSEEFSGAFLVTESFFDPGALEVTSEATQGGLLSRDKRKSFVNLSRKRGYHLCLVEARSEEFHLAVPEL